MENDIVRASGEDTVVDLWIEGRLRAITVPRLAVEAFLQAPPEQAVAMTQADRREFVRKHLSLIGKAVTTHVRTNPEARAVVIAPGALRGRDLGVRP